MWSHLMWQCGECALHFDLLVQLTEFSQWSIAHVENMVSLVTSGLVDKEEMCITKKWSSGKHRGSCRVIHT